VQSGAAPVRFPKDALQSTCQAVKGANYMIFIDIYILSGVDNAW
jgi:hypothetical protein